MATSQVTIPGTEQTGTPTPKSGGGFFSKIGTFLRQNGPALSGAISDIGAQLAAAGGNYAPIELAHQAKVDALQRQLAQSQMETAGLNRQLLSKQVENYESPEQQRNAAVTQAGALERARNENAAPTETTGQLPTGETGRFSKKWNPATGDFDIKPEMATQEVANPTQAPGAGMPPPLGGKPLLPPSPTVNQRHQLTVPQQVGFHVVGYDANNNPIVSEYSKGGAPMGSVPAPTPTNVAVPTSPWKTYLETGRKQGLSDADIVNRWNTQESTRSGIKMVPQPDGSIVPVAATEGSVSHRSPLGSGGATSTPSPFPAIPRAGVGTPGPRLAGTRRSL